MEFLTLEWSLHTTPCHKQEEKKSEQEEGMKWSGKQFLLAKKKILQLSICGIVFCLLFDIMLDAFFCAVFNKFFINFLNQPTILLVTFFAEI